MYTDKHKERVIRPKTERPYAEGAWSAYLQHLRGECAGLRGDADERRRPQRADCREQVALVRRVVRKRLLVRLEFRARRAHQAL